MLLIYPPLLLLLGLLCEKLSEKLMSHDQAAQYTLKLGSIQHPELGHCSLRAAAL